MCLVDKKLTRINMVSTCTCIYIMYGLGLRTFLYPEGLVAKLQKTSQNLWDKKILLILRDRSCIKCCILHSMKVSSCGSCVVFWICNPVSLPLYNQVVTVKSTSYVLIIHHTRSKYTVLLFVILPYVSLLKLRYNWPWVFCCKYMFLQRIPLHI